MTRGQFFQRSLIGLNSEFSFSKTCFLTKAEEPSLPYHLPIAGGRIIGFIPFPRVLVLCEMQSVSSRIWTRVTMSISYDDNHYTTGTSIIIIKYCRLHRFPWLSLSIHPYRPLLLVGRLLSSLCTELMNMSCVVSQHWCVHTCESIGGPHFWVRPFLLQEFPTFLLRLTWMVCDMRGKWTYSSHFVGCCFQDLFKIAHSMLV